MRNSGIRLPGLIAAALIAVAVVTAPAISRQVDGSDEAYLQVPGGQYDWFVVDPYGTVLKKFLWKNTQIPVCWDETPLTDEEARLRLVVQEAVRSSWPRHSAIDFLGWGTCTDSRERGVHILVRDSETRTRGIGSYLDARYGGVTLNFEFSNWRPACQQDTSKDDCIRYLAVHEFGHVLGFVHEQIRNDAPPECRGEVGTRGARGDWKVTAYDPFSIMNYCSSVWALYSHSAKPEPGEMLQTLSAKDRAAVLKVYGAHPPHPSQTPPVAIRGAQ